LSQTYSSSFKGQFIDLDETGWPLMSNGDRVPAKRIGPFLEERLNPPRRATDILVYVHGWRTSPDSALAAARRIESMARRRFAESSALYPRVGSTGFEPWTVVVRWPSASAVNRKGYELIRARAHAMGAQAQNGHAAHVIGHLLGYLDERRENPRKSGTLATRDGQYLHLMGHSFGCRLLCEAVLWAADASVDRTLGWTNSGRGSARAFTVDSFLLFQMAAPQDAFTTVFSGLLPGPPGKHLVIRCPIVATHSRHDRATGFWHTRAEGKPGIGHSGIKGETFGVSRMLMRSTAELYSRQELDNPFVDIDASFYFSKANALNPAGAHSAHTRAESAHLLLSLADHSR
jgi:hypothetical protein